jgi:uncharacterized MAPEG superfamily protein
MMTTVQALVWSGILTFLMLVLGLLLRTQAWSPSGLMVAFSDREGVVAPLGMAGRADRAANNMIEAMAMFLALVLAASIAGKAPQAAMGATVFFWARVVYWPVYLAGIPVLRTLVWLVSIVGLILILKEVW